MKAPVVVNCGLATKKLAGNPALETRPPPTGGVSSELWISDARPAGLLLAKYVWKVETVRIVLELTPRGANSVSMSGEVPPACTAWYACRKPFSRMFTSLML